jgi:hypothetical protein
MHKQLTKQTNRQPRDKQHVKQQTYSSSPTRAQQHTLVYASTALLLGSVRKKYHDSSRGTGLCGV